jgi:hypothetical protein
MRGAAACGLIEVMASLLDRLLDKLYHTQLALIALVTAVVAVVMLWAWDFFVVDSGAPRWVVDFPVHAVGDAALGGAFVTVIFEVIVRRVVEIRTQRLLDETIEKIFTEPATALAVAGSPMGERLAINGLRVLTEGDAEIARALHDRLEAQLAGSSQVWRDVALTATVSEWGQGSATGPEALFELTLKCSYRTVVQHPQLWFLCTSNPSEHDAAGRDPANAATWLIEPNEPLSATDPETFSVVGVQVDGQRIELTHSQTEQSQKYVADLPESMLGRLVTVTYTYRVLIMQSASPLWLTTSQLTLGFSATFNYSNTAIRYVSTGPYLGNTEPGTAISKTPGSVAARSVTVARDGLILPGEGVVFGWVFANSVTPEPAR